MWFDQNPRKIDKQTQNKCESEISKKDINNLIKCKNETNGNDYHLLISASTQKINTQELKIKNMNIFNIYYHLVFKDYKTFSYNLTLIVT